MTTNSSTLLCIRFDFGLPLEDIFPPDDIHPRLHNLFYQTTLAFQGYGHIPFRYILKNYEVSLNETFELKTELINGKLSYKESMSPSSFIWLIRHFLGLLPLPLFPHFTDNKIYKWEYLATQCRLCNMSTDEELISEISWWIHKLPKPNIILLYNLVDFLRKICQMMDRSGKLNWKNIITATTYFSSSVFFRPYRPGTITTTDHLYYPLLAYIIVKWAKIRKFQTYQTNDNQLFCILETNEPISLLDVGCQTSHPCLEAATSDKNVETEYLEDSSQTDNQLTEKFDKQCGVDENESLAPTYEEIPEEKHSSANSATTIHKKNLKRDTKIFTPKILFKTKLSKANLSLVNAISKIKSKQELFKTKSGSKLHSKYRLLEKDQNVAKAQSFHVRRCAKESPNIKYKKLMTL